MPAAGHDESAIFIDRVLYRRNDVARGLSESDIVRMCGEPFVEPFLDDRSVA
jgi:hypothetical protein